MTNQPVWPTEIEPVFREACAAAEADEIQILREIADAAGRPDWPDEDN